MVSLSSRRSDMRVRAVSFLWLSCLLEFSVLFHSLSLVCAADVFVDDNDGTLSYSPSDTWEQGNGCSSCALHPDASQTFDGTWHDTTYHAGNAASTITLKFTGVGVSAIFVVPDKTQGDASVGTNLVFTLDGSQAGTYTHSPSGGADFLYNQTLFEKSGLSNDDHTLVVSAAAPDGQSSAVLFDYFIYTTGDGTTSSTVTSTTTSSSSSSSSSSVVSNSPSSSGSSTGTSTGNPSSSTAGLSSGSSSSTTTSGTSSSSSSSLSSSSGSLFSGTISAAAASASSNANESVPVDHKTNVGAIAGGVIGGVLGLLLASLLVLFCRKRARRAREDKEDTTTIPGVTNTERGGTTERTRSWLGFEPGVESTLMSHPVTFSDQSSSSVMKGESRIQPADLPGNSITPATYEKSGPVVSQNTAFQSTLVPSIAAEGEQRPSGSTQTDDGQSSNADAHTHNLSPTVNAAEILNQVTAIHAAVLSLQEQRMNGQTVGVDGTVPPPYST